MHHSFDPRRRTLACAHYIDDSGSDENSLTAVVGGPIFAQKHFSEFHYEWDRTVLNHGLEPPIHMNEFMRPHGRFAAIQDSKRREIFHDLIYLINRFKVYSLTSAVDNLSFQQFFPSEVFRGHLTAASFAFLWCLILNHSIVKAHQEKMARMAYIVGHSPQSAQMTDCHKFFVSFEAALEQCCTGALAYDDPKAANALQAADLVAWANLRKCLGRPFNQGFEPLELLTRDVESEVKPAIHFHFPVTDKSARALAEIVREPVRVKGRRYSILGTFVPDEWQSKL